MDTVTNNACILRAEQVSRTFITGNTTVQALSEIDFSARKNRITCLRGRSGSGKTTLLNILGVLDHPSAGSVFFLDREITGLSDEGRDRIRRYEMAFVFQSVALIPAMTAYENVEFALRLAGFPHKGRDTRAKECLVRVGLEKRMFHRPGELSGGEQQRVAIARAVCHRPKVLFADEPTAQLDSVTGLAVMNLFRDLIRTEELSIVMTTHDAAVMETADEVYTLEDGRITGAVQYPRNT